MTHANQNRPSAREQQQSAEASTLARFGKDLTQFAREGKTSPCFGRDSEIRQVLTALCKSKKRNVILTGPEGVGKTALIEGLAQLIVQGRAPRSLSESRIIQLDMNAVVAGASFKGEFEERLRTLLDEVIRSGSILFIDEFHTVIGGGNPAGGMDAANIMKPALARGEFQCIGATTDKEFREIVEKDRALCRRFQSVKVNEPTADMTADILLGALPKLGSHNNLIIPREVVGTVVQLSGRYVPDRRFPDKALDLLDESAALCRLRNEGTKAQAGLDTLKELKRQAIASGDFEGAAEIHRRILFAQEGGGVP